MKLRGAGKAGLGYLQNKDTFVMRVKYGRVPYAALKTCFCGKEFLTSLRRRILCRSCADLLETAEGRDRVRMAVRIRDKFTCQKCGEERRPENVGKNKQFSRSLEAHRKDGRCGRLRKRYEAMEEIHNFTTLCHQCHSRAHGSFYAPKVINTLGPITVDYPPDEVKMKKYL